MQTPENITDIKQCTQRVSLVNVCNEDEDFFYEWLPIVLDEWLPIDVK